MEENKNENVEKETPVNVDTSSTPENSANKTAEPKKKKAGTKIAVIIIILAILAGGIGAAVYFLIFAPKEIDLSKYLTVEYAGYNGYATATVTIDEKELKKELDDSKLAKKFAEKAKIEIKDNEDLKNGNNLQVKVDISSTWLENNKLKLKSDNVSIKVEGLEEAEVIDLFEDLDITVEGVSPELRMSVNNNNSDKFIRTVTYKMEDSEGATSSSQLTGLANGDKVFITAQYNQTDLDDAGYVVAEETYEYTIKDEPEYISSKDQVNDSIKETIKTNLLEEVKDAITQNDNDAIYYAYDNIKWNESFTNTEPELMNMYLLTPKKSVDSYYWGTSNNIVYAIFKVVYTSTETGTAYEYYYTANIEDAAIDDEKFYDTIKYDYEVSSTWGGDEYGKTQDEAYDYFIDSKKTDYIIEDLGK